MRPISARFSVVAQFVIPRQARLILHNREGARKRFFDTELPGPSGARQTRASSKSDSDEKRNEAVSIESRLALRTNDDNETLTALKARLVHSGQQESRRPPFSESATIHSQRFTSRYRILKDTQELFVSRDVRCHAP